MKPCVCSAPWWRKSKLQNRRRPAENQNITLKEADVTSTTEEMLSHQKDMTNDIKLIVERCNK